MRTRSITNLTAAILALTATQALCAGNNDAMAWHSPMHPQFELVTPLSNQLDFRFGISRFDSFSPTDQLQSALANETTPVFSASALVDWQALPGGLHLTGGALYGDLGWSYMQHTAGFAGAERSYRSLSSRALDQDRSYLDDVKPYFGLGWNDQFGPDGNFRLQLDLGLVFQSVEPGSKESLSSDYLGNSGADAGLGQTFQSFRYSPVFSAGFRYRF
ncbi:MAG: hypothetical protein L0H63_07095 [Nitrococcus sp.]|nr:hypothetical protein [Nitrococcus sp.]